MRKLKLSLGLVGLMGLVNMAQAQVVTEKPGAFPEGLPFDHAGHVDLGYNSLSGSGKFINGVNDRVFDFDRRALNLQSLDLTLSKLPETGFGGLVNFTVGKDADTIASYGTIDRARGPAAGVDKRFDVTQGYVQYVANGFTVIGGKYVTLAGAEVIKAPSNTNFSRSILFGYAIPFAHTGVRVSYQASDTLSLTAGLNNGWDAFKDTNGDKTWELAFAYTPSKAFALAGQAYVGKEQIFNYPTISPIKGTRNLVDLVATYNATEQLTLVLNYDNGSQENAVLVNGASGTAKWDGWAGYANYQINEQWRLSLRGEWFNDKDGYRTAVGAGKTAGQKWKEATLTLAYLPNKNWELRGEVRADKSDQAVFLATNAVTAKDNQSSFGLQALYKF